MEQKEYNVIGVMSGTSLDGLDIALVKFVEHNNKWLFDLIAGETYEYDKKWKEKLITASSLPVTDFLLLHREYGQFISDRIKDFLEEYDNHVDIISSHGHTVIHRPDLKTTFQLGDGYTIAKNTQITTIADFRTKDVVMNGQGAPLVPYGDKLLFEEYDYCINLGGFANISYDIKGTRYAFDICPVNTIINFYAEKLSLSYDIDGRTAKKGKLNRELLGKLNQIRFYRSLSPKSLGIEWLEREFIPVIESYNIPIEDKLRTVYEHIAIQIALSTTFNKDSKILLTGGGAYNKFLVKLIRKRINHRIIIPDDYIIDYKEALIFSLLGLLRYQNKINCLASVTGALKDTSCGIIYEP